MAPGVAVPEKQATGPAPFALLQKQPIFTCTLSCSFMCSVEAGVMSWSSLGYVQANDIEVMSISLLQFTGVGMYNISPR